MGRAECGQGGEELSDLVRDAAGVGDGFAQDELGGEGGVPLMQEDELGGGKPGGVSREGRVAGGGSVSVPCRQRRW